METNAGQLVAWKNGWKMWLVLLGAAAGLVLVFFDGLASMADWWVTREEYSHGPLIPFVVAFLLWQKKDQLELVDFSGSWLGVAIVIVGLTLFYFSELGGMYVGIQYAFLLTLYGMTLSLLGSKGFKIIAMPLLILAFMVPLPSVLYHSLSSQLQLISSQLGVALIRLFDISVYLEGNVIDLGTYKLQVVDACSGLRYLFPLMTLGFIAAYFFNAAWWKKTVVFLSTIPITILMNSIRVGAIGVTVEYWGPKMAEGLLHDFEGWAVFMGSLAILIAEMWMLSAIGKRKLPFREVFGLQVPGSTPKEAKTKYRVIPIQQSASLSILMIALIGTYFVLDTRSELIPDRKPYADFPLAIGDWKGRGEALEQIYIDKLKLTDYALADYVGADGAPVNFYSAYYASQRKDSTTHTPSDCLPGGGWQIKTHDRYRVPGVEIDGKPLTVNRLLIEKGGFRQLVYYWFQQRGRIVTSEILMKWYFFVDAIVKNRTDGALIRLTTALATGQDVDIADKRLMRFAKSISPLIPEYVPN